MTRQEGSPPAGRRPRGRPRDPLASQRILAAAREIVAKHGIHGASMSAVAEHSGTGKPTVYLRWENITAVIVSAISELRRPLSEHDSPCVQFDIFESLREDHDFFLSSENSGFLRSVVVGAPSEPTIADELEEAIRGPRRARLVATLERGMESGALRANLAADALAELLVSPIIHALVATDFSFTHETLKIHVDSILHGIALEEPATV